jgi:DNA-binding NarL/FixJ family response regulator
MHRRIGSKNRSRVAKTRAASASKSPAKARQKSPARGSASSKIRILLADNQPIDRSGLAAMLRTQSDFDVVGEASTAEQSVDLCRSTSPSVVILALRLPSSTGQQALPILRAHAPDVPVLAVAERGEGQCLVLNPPRRAGVIPLASGLASPPEHHRDECMTGTDCLQLAVAEGATGTIRRTAEPEELFRAIRIVAAGKAWYEAGTASAIMRHALARTKAEGRTDLSDREMEVAELIANGRSNKEISQALDISEPTVKKHVGHILAKLKLQDRLQIGLYVARNPLVLRRSGSRV